MRNRHARRGLPVLAAAAVLLLQVPEVAQAAPSSDWMDYTIVAREKLVIGPNINVGGSFATIEPGGILRVSQGTFQLDGIPDPLVAGYDLTLASHTSVVDVYTDTLNASGTATIRGSLTQPYPFPLGIVLPPIPAQSFDPCTESAPDIVVAGGTTVQLSPGCYHELKIKADGRVVLEPGDFLFFNWDLRSRAEVLTLGGDVDVYVRRNVHSTNDVQIRASSGDPKELQFWIANETGAKDVIGKFNTVIATIYAPEDPSLNFNKGALLIGSAVGRTVDIAGQHNARPPTPTPSPTPSPTPTPTPTPTPSPTPSGTAVTPSPTPTQMPSPSPSGTAIVPPTPTPACKEDLKAQCTLWVIEDPAALPPAYTTLQAAVDASVGGDVICVFARTVENVVIDVGHELEITQCTLAEVTADDPAAPVVSIVGTGPVLVIGLDATGGTVGWEVVGSGHELRGVRAYDNSGDGILLGGNDNLVSVNRVDHNGACGIRVTGDDNVMRSGKYSQNQHGICLEGAGNEVRNVDAENNAQDGVSVTGNGNLVRSVSSNDNGRDGYSVSGANNQLKYNDGDGNAASGVLVGTTASNTLVKDNKLFNSGGCEYLVLGTGTSDGGGSNQANGVKFTNIEAGGCFE